MIDFNSIIYENKNCCFPSDEDSNLDPISENILIHLNDRNSPSENIQELIEYFPGFEEKSFPLNIEVTKPFNLTGKLDNEKDKYLNESYPVYKGSKKIIPLSQAKGYNINNEDINIQLFKNEKDVINFFQVKNPTKQVTNEENYINFSNKKKGRPKKNEKNNEPKHKGNSLDNLLRIIHVHYLNFIIYFVNDILSKNFTIKERFIKIDYGYKSKINKILIEYYKKQSIGDIISSIKSRKNTKVEDKHNNQLKEKIEENKNLKRILSMNYLDFFQKFYLKGNKIINLDEYDFQKIILPEKTIMLDDLYKKYNFNSIIQCLKKYFFQNNKKFIKKIFFGATHQ